MTRDVYMKIIKDGAKASCAVCVEIKQRSHYVATSHEKNMYTGGTKPHERYIPWDMCNASFPLPPLGKELDDEHVPPMEPYYEPKQQGFRLPEEKKDVELYAEKGLDETGHKKENPLLKLLHADTDMEVEKNMELLSEISEEEDEVTLYRLLREVSGVVDPCHFCKEIKVCTLIAWWIVQDGTTWIC